MLKKDQHFDSPFAVETLMQCTNSQKFRDPHIPYIFQWSALDIYLISSFCHQVMWRQKILCDVTIIVGHHRMRVHKALLATCADYFRNLFANAPDDQKVANSEVSSQLGKSRYVYGTK